MLGTMKKDKIVNNLFLKSKQSVILTKANNSEVPLWWATPSDNVWGDGVIRSEDVSILLNDEDVQLEQKSKFNISKKYIEYFEPLQI